MTQSSHQASVALKFGEQHESSENVISLFHQREIQVGKSMSN